MSDHLPIMMDVKITLPGSNSITKADELIDIQFNNLIEDELRLKFNGQKNIVESIYIVDITGKRMREIRYQQQEVLTENLSNLKAGIYFLQLNFKNKRNRTERIIKI